MSEDKNEIDTTEIAPANEVKNKELNWEYQPEDADKENEDGTVWPEESEAKE